MRTVASILLPVLLLAGCSPKVTTHLAGTYPPLGPDEVIAVVELYAPEPENATPVGLIRIEDSGLTTQKNGSYEHVIALAKEQARAAGGNVVRLTRHWEPDFHSSIHRIEARILLVDDISELILEPVQALNPDHPDCAIVHFYCMPGYYIDYDVHIGEDTVFRALEASKGEVELHESGEIEIWAKTESRASIPLQVEHGGDYYVRCEYEMGVLTGRPSLELVPAPLGRNEYDSILAREAPENARPQTTFRFSVEGGGAFSTGRVPSELDAVVRDHYKKLKWGYSYGADATWFFAGNVGVGLKYHNLHAAHSVDVTATSKTDGSVRNGKLEDRMDTCFIGPFISYRHQNAERTHAFVLLYGLGYMARVDKAILIDPYTERGATLGTTFEIGYEKMLTDHLALGASFALYSGTLATTTITDQDGVQTATVLGDDEQISLDHLTLSLGLRYCF